MFAVIEVASKQYKVKGGDIIDIPLSRRKKEVVLDKAGILLDQGPADRIQNVGCDGIEPIGGRGWPAAWFGRVGALPLLWDKARSAEWFVLWGMSIHRLFRVRHHQATVGRKRGWRSNQSL